MECNFLVCVVILKFDNFCFFEIIESCDYVFFLFYFKYVSLYVERIKFYVFFLVMGFLIYFFNQMILISKNVENGVVKDLFIMC